ncbi:MAG: cation diffusion facilitator family transporter [Acidobacteriota bacterium]
MGAAHPTSDPAVASRRLKLAFGLCLAYMTVELVGGFLANSLALLADAGHMLADAGSIGLALFAARLSLRPPSKKLTYGYHRAEILAATLNAATLLAVGLSILVEAFRRLAHPPQVASGVMLAVAVPGLVVNLAMAAVLHGGGQKNLNVRAAFLHVLTDTLGSVQVILAALAMMWFGWAWADPVASMLLSGLVMFSGYRVLRETVFILMEGTPAQIDLDQLRQSLLAVEGVVGVHDLHVWLIASDFVAASVHLEVSDSADDSLLWQVRKLLAEKFDIHHSTVQLERRPSPRTNLLPVYPKS